VTSSLNGEWRTTGIRETVLSAAEQVVQPMLPCPFFARLGEIIESWAAQRDRHPQQRRQDLFKRQSSIHVNIPLCLHGSVTIVTPPCNGFGGRRRWWRKSMDGFYKPFTCPPRPAG
jgi:hypothetical protein